MEFPAIDQQEDDPVVLPPLQEWFMTAAIGVASLGVLMGFLSSVRPVPGMHFFVYLSLFFFVCTMAVAIWDIE